MIKFARRVQPHVTLDNVDVTGEIKDHLKAFSFTDNISGEADSVSLTLADRDGKWRGSQRPKQGSQLKCSFGISTGWDDMKVVSRSIGLFEIDRIRIGGPPKEISFDALSIPQSSSLSKAQKTKGWEKANLKKVAGDIARANDMKLYFSAADNPQYDRVDQEGQTDLSFLMKLCTEASMTLKIADRKLIIMDERKLEEAQEKLVINEKDKAIKDYSGDSSITGLYRSCSVRWTDPKTKKSKRYTFTPTKRPQSNRILYVNEEIKSESAAKKLAMAKLREANKEAVTFSLKLAGFINIHSGETIRLTGFDSFDGKYIATTVSATLVGGTETSISLRKVLEGY